jgi:hypothetical protein
MDLAAHFRIILRSWKKILIVAVVVGILVFLYSNRSARVYRATELLAVTPSDTGAGQSNAQQANYLAQSYALLVDTPSVAGRAAKASGLGITTDEAEAFIRAMLAGGRDLVAAAYGSSVPVVAACTGHAIACGAFVLLGCDDRVGPDADARRRAGTSGPTDRRHVLGQQCGGKQRGHDG